MCSNQEDKKILKSELQLPDIQKRLVTLNQDLTNTDFDSVNSEFIGLIIKNIQVQKGIFISLAFPKFCPYNHKKILEPILLYYIRYRTKEHFETKFTNFIFKVIAEACLRYFSLKDVSSFLDKVTKEVIESDYPDFKFKESYQANDDWKENLRRPVKTPRNYRKKQRLVLVLLAAEMQLDYVDLLKKDIEVEHIYPQAGENDDDRIYTIGNLTLLEKKLNGKASNHDFCDKKNNYQKSKITITQELYEMDSWDFDEIDSRTEDLISDLEGIFGQWQVDYRELLNTN